MPNPKNLIHFLFIIGLFIQCQPKKAPTEEAPKATLFYKIEALLGEGPIWNYESNELYWVDIDGRFLHILNPSTKENRSLQAPLRVGTVVPIDADNALVALDNGAYVMNTTSGDVELLAPLDSGNYDTRLNDGKCDPAGRLWVGTMHMPQTKADGNLYMVNGAGEVTHRLDSITISNGIVWSSDKKTMYYIDTPTNKIQAFDYNNATGAISNKRIAVDIPIEVGSPDGMAIDVEDKLWVGMWNGDAVVRFDPETGEIMQKIEVPAHNVTACAFGGQNLDSLFITSSRYDMTPEEIAKYPDAGSVFVAVPGVRGVKSDFFKLAEK